MWVLRDMQLVSVAFDCTVPYIWPTSSHDAIIVYARVCDAYHVQINMCVCAANAGVSRYFIAGWLATKIYLDSPRLLYLRRTRVSAVATPSGY